jgi:hypothetical protein
MSIALLANENFPAPAIRKLRAAGVNVVAISEVMPATSDKDVMEYARREQRWIVTFTVTMAIWFSGKDCCRRPPFSFSAKSLIHRIALPIWYWQCFPCHNKRKAAWWLSANEIFGASISLPTDE